VPFFDNRYITRLPIPRPLAWDHLTVDEKRERQCKTHQRLEASVSIKIQRYGHNPPDNISLTTGWRFADLAP
jgi:hypothetical protein